MLCGAYVHYRRTNMSETSEAVDMREMYRLLKDRVFPEKAFTSYKPSVQIIWITNKNGEVYLKDAHSKKRLVVCDMSGTLLEPTKENMKHVLKVTGIKPVKSSNNIYLNIT